MADMAQLWRRKAYGKVLSEYVQVAGLCGKQMCGWSSKDWGWTEYRNWYLGDWATPKGINQTDPRSVDLVGNCVLSESYDLMSRIADVLGNEEDSGRFREKHERQNDLIHKTFFNPSDNTYATATQIDMAYPMLVGAVPQSCVRDVVSSMKKRTAETFKGHLATGLVGVPSFQNGQ